MPQEPNKLLRPLAVAGAFLIVIAGFFAMYFSSKRTTQQQLAQNAAAQASSPETPAPVVKDPAAADPVVESQPQQSQKLPPVPETSAKPTTPASSSSTDSKPESKPEPKAAPTINAPSLRARVWPADPAASTAQIASSHLIARFSVVGAGIAALQTADHYETIERVNRVDLQSEYTTPVYDPAGNALTTAAGVPLTTIVAPLAALGLEINGQFINLSVDAAGSLWKFTPPSTFTAEIADDKDQTAMRITRTYSLAADAHNLLVAQNVENLSNAPISFRFIQIGPVDLPMDAATYVGEKRRLRFGYLLSPQYDPTQSFVQSRDYVIEHSAVLGTKQPNGHYTESVTEWPNALSKEKQFTLSWIGLTNRYFGVALHTPITLGATGAALIAEKPLHSVEQVDRLVLERPPVNGHPNDVVALRLTSPSVTVQPGKAADLSLSLYGGALIRSEINANPAGQALSLNGLVLYSMPGPCAFCTFNFLTSFLLWLLTFLHSIVHDWALSIILLVVVVRTILHPVTKWSQVRMQRFGKQMAAMGPKQAKLKEKYGNDPKTLQAETAKLWREEGISPMGMLGCLPMFLQTPIWLALYATLFFAAQLRHQPAFYGVFQKLGHTTFLADLSVPDNFWVFSQKGINIPLLSSMLGPVTSINILPLILSVVFYLHQKYLTPPTTTQLTPEQQTQQTMIKWISLIMFPVLMYNAPAGLTIYFVANSALGIVEHKRIRAHINKHDLLNLDKIKEQKGKKGAGSGGGFFSRMQELVEQQRKAAEAAGRAKPKR
ncbi:MAG: YidC/Oxa1 family insertase periplasmic-domain containing protein [Phycisphaeraceae bacterium]|nr:YidC/Oxa1 family insertase periplasmic-domain containing protein [Phycisphaeraceae bacterium]